MPYDLNEFTVLITGHEARTVTRSGARELLRLLDIRQPRDILATHLSSDAQSAFSDAAFDLQITTDYVYMPFEGIPPELLQQP